ncbi:MAG: ATP-binding protein, partial [Desulfomonilia bacterium]
VISLLETGSRAELDAMLAEAGEAIQARITVISSQGAVLADSRNAPDAMENHLNRPEVIAALTGSTGRSVRYSTTLGRDMIYVALPLETHRGVTAALRTSIPAEDIDTLMAGLRSHALELSAVIVLLALLLAFFFSLAISRPIRRLSRVAGRLAAGDFSARITLKSGDEIQELAESFNHMAGRLESAFAELSAGKEELEGIVSSMTEGLMVLDSQARIRMANRSALDIVGCGDASGRYAWELIRSPDFDRLLEESLTAPARGSIDLGDKTFLCSIAPILSGRARVMLLHDITWMRRLEKIKRDLALNVSHELRTPLSAIKGFAETLREESTGEHLEYLEVILRNADRLIGIVDGLLELSELEGENPAIDIREVRLREIVEGVFSLFRQKLEEKGLTASVEETRPGVTIRGDPFRIEQLFINLIDNAIKYTQEGGITVSLGGSQNIAVIKVSDTGIGIPREHLGRIFERFYVVDKSRSRKLGGTGLGLSIVKRIVSLHRGTISVSSRPCEGTSFTITLPLDASSPEDRAA